MKSIEMFFFKELFFALIIMIVYIYIFLIQYGTDFRGDAVYYPNIKGNFTEKIVNGTKILTTALCQNLTEICYGIDGYADFYSFSKHNRTVYSIDEKYENDTAIYRPTIIQEKFEAFGGYSTMQYTISSLLSFSIILRSIFNINKYEEVNLLLVDKFLSMDLLFSGTAMCVFMLI